jgi:lipopolysaccharide/colanic/teichoic acid biosynthesis glycosyltransferase
MKYIFDFLASLLGLLILSPIFLVLAIWISLESPGGPFYLQERIGRYGKPFHLIKFRSMRKGSDRNGLLTVGKDPRITRSGAFIRKYKLDELAQLINVLKGDMSLVGPRPEVKKYVDLYTEEQRQVLSVRPGITDWASIKYRHENELLGASSNPEETYIHQIMPDKLQINLDYIRRRSFRTDLHIIFLTIFRLFS